MISASFFNHLYLERSSNSFMALSGDAIIHIISLFETSLSIRQILICRLNYRMQATYFHIIQEQKCLLLFVSFLQKLPAICT